MIIAHKWVSSRTIWDEINEFTGKPYKSNDWQGTLSYYSYRQKPFVNSIKWWKLLWFFA
jgi:hypothetical protein